MRRFLLFIVANAIGFGLLALAKTAHGIAAIGLFLIVFFAYHIVRRLLFGRY